MTMSLADSLARLFALLPALDSLCLPEPPLIDRSGSLALPPLAVGPSAVPGAVKLRATIVKEIAYIEKLLAASPSTPDETSQQQQPEPATNASHLFALFSSLAAAPSPLIGINQTFSLPKLVRSARFNPGTSTVGHGATQEQQQQQQCSNRARAKAPPREVKVNAVCAGGQRWIKILSGLTVSRLGFELGEDDAFDSDSSNASVSSSTSAASRSSSIAALKQSPHFDRSHAKTTLHKAAHALLSATNVVSPLVPKPAVVELQLPRFTREALARLPAEHRRRVEAVLDEVRSLPGVEVSLAPSPDETATRSSEAPAFVPSPLKAYRPTTNLVLDLSLLIALLSGISHMALPPRSAGPEGVFLPLVRQYRKDGTLRTEAERSAAMLGGSENVRALTVQLGVEMEHPLVDELVDGSALVDGEVVCWATEESRQRLETIVRKLASPEELLRARTVWAVEGESATEREERTRRWWAASRYADGLTPLHRALSDVRLLPSSSPTDALALAPPETTRSRSAGPDQHTFTEMHLLLSHLLRSSAHSSDETSIDVVTIPRLSPSLTPHTIRTLCAATSRGWTTVTTNRASLMRLYKYLEEVGADPSLGAAGGRADDEEQSRRGLAVAWVLEPRSLAESMRM